MGYYSTLKKNSDASYNLDESQKNMLNEKIQTQKSAYCTVLFI